RALQRRAVGEGKVLEGGSGKFVARLPSFIADPAADTAISLVVAVLLEPEARGRRVEHAAQVEGLVLAGSFAQLDHRRRLREHLPYPVQHERAMRGHKRKRNRQRSYSRAEIDFLPFPPRQSNFCHRGSKPAAAID